MAPGAIFGLPNIYESCVVHAQDRQHHGDARVQDVNEELVIHAYMDLIIRVRQFKQYDTDKRYDRLTAAVEQLKDQMNITTLKCPDHCRNVGICHVLNEQSEDSARLREAIQPLINLIPAHQDLKYPPKVRSTSNRRSFNGYIIAWFYEATDLLEHVAEVCDLVCEKGYAILNDMAPMIFRSVIICQELSFV